MSIIERVLPTMRGAVYPYVGGTEWAAWRLMDIEDSGRDGFTYLRRRIIVKTPWFAVYLHRIFVVDSDRWLHNHPFAFASVVLAGGYTEQRDTKPYLRQRKRWSIAKTRLTDFHRITHLHTEGQETHKGAVTLVLCGPRRQEWGFATPAGFKTWREVEF